MRTASFIIQYFVLTILGTTLHAQTVRPYVGASGNLMGIAPPPGAGVEAGVLGQSLYAGLEWGLYSGHEVSEVLPYALNGSTDVVTDGPEYYLAVHGGISLSPAIRLGVVGLLSYETTTTDRAYTTYWCDAGIDLRIKTSAASPLMLATAFSHRRGLKIGLDWIF